MPIGDFEHEVLRCIAANRHPDSVVAGGTVLHRLPDTPRFSRDVDLFDDDPANLKAAAEADTGTLRAAGYEVAVTATADLFIRAEVRRGELGTKIEWVSDSAFRFFPIEPDLEIGWRLNFWDVATNKILAAAGRRAVRDYLDVIYLSAPSAARRPCMGGGRKRPRPESRGVEKMRRARSHLRTSIFGVRRVEVALDSAPFVA